MDTPSDSTSGITAATLGANGPRRDSASAMIVERWPLPRLSPKACATISHIEADDDDINRLKAMGVCIGRKVELVQAGDPLILRVLGSRLGVSARLAQRVYVDVCMAPECHPATPIQTEPTPHHA